ncbi:alpha/beta fold hydrolase [Nocardioides sp. cx-169]|uniref:alpha/beta fold hydrolase n=1 Tax=Nocardioides sp. cx-169 TaxID=2899080 RepID=UPI001E2FDA85|nr:alpha/beta fold hydrolase [Nocardioides sp. cx-169]MCD4532552.1 alpha/beta fold hydrolase [Nocardioides sp. cx-169]
MSRRIRTLSREGLTFDVLDDGPLDGDVVVLLHGFPERATSWRYVAPLLHAAGLRTLALDQRGYSEGARPRGRRAYRLSELVDDVAALVERVGGAVHVVGHDWGAAVAWGLAARRPVLVRTLTAVSVPHPAAFQKAMLSSPQPLRSWYTLLFQAPYLVELSARVRGGPFDRALARAGMTREEVLRCRHEVVDTGALSGGLSWYRALPFVDRALATARTTVPTTFVWSDGDSAIDRRGAQLTAAYVDAPYAFVELPGVSHWIPTQAPERLASTVLDRVWSV